MRAHRYLYVLSHEKSTNYKSFCIGNEWDIIYCPASVLMVNTKEGGGRPEVKLSLLLKLFLSGA